MMKNGNLLLGLSAVWWVIILSVCVASAAMFNETITANQWIEFLKWSLGFGTAKTMFVEGMKALKGN